MTAEGVVTTAGREGRAVAQDRMVQALRSEGFTVEPDAAPRAQQCICSTCDGQKNGCPDCLDLGYGWLENNVRRVAP